MEIAHQSDTEKQRKERLRVILEKSRYIYHPDGNTTHYHRKSLTCERC